MSPRSSRRRRFGGALAAAAATVLVIGGGLGVREVIDDEPPPSGDTANLWAAPTGTGGSGPCTRSATRITYAAAITADAVCDTLHRACQAASGGDLVLWKGGNYSMNYTQFDLPVDHDDGLGHDCSKGAGGAYNPNWQEQGVAQGSLTGWVRFECGDGENTDVSFGWAGSDDLTVYFSSNAHVHFYGGCFRWGDVRVDYSGSTGLTTQNIIMEGGNRRWAVYALEARGAKNILIKKWENRPLALCAATSTGVASQYKCVPANTQTGEDFGNAINVGPSGLSGVQIPWFGSNVGGASINLRSEDSIIHDMQTKAANEGPGLDWHSGCGYTFGNLGTGANGSDNGNASHNIVIDRLRCYRVNIFGYQVQNSNGVTVQNSSFGAWSEPMANNANTWWFDESSGAQPGVTVVCNLGVTTQSNVLVRYNSSVGPIHITSCTSGTNMRAIGNVALQGYSCDSYATWDYNVSGTTACGTNSTGSAASPFTTDIRTSVAYVPSASTVLASNVGFDSTLTSGTKAWENTVTPTGADYALPFDKDGDTRSNPRTPGADER